MVQKLKQWPYIDLLLAVGVLLLLQLILFWRIFFLGEALLATDLIFQTDPLWREIQPAGFVQPGNELFFDQTYQFYPWESLARTEENDLLLWNPHNYAGQPFLANAQSSLFSVFRVAASFFPINASFSVSVFLQLFVAGFFTYLFAREVTGKVPGALLAMIVFVLGAPMVVWLVYPLTAVYVWLPVLLWLVERLLQTGRWLYVLLLALVTGLQFFGGNPEPSFHILLVTAVYLFYRLLGYRGGWRQSWAALRQQWQIPLKALLAVVWGVALASIQLLPFLAYMPESSIFLERTEAPLSVSKVLFSWQEWPALLTAILPRIFGTPINRSYWYPFSNYNEQNLYAGIIPLVLTLFVGWLWLRKRLKRQDRVLVTFFMGLTIFSLAVAVSLPFFAGINYLPIFELANNGRLRFIYLFALAILSGVGLNVLLDKDMWQENNRAFYFILLAIACISLLGIVAANIGLTVMREPILAMGRAQAETAVQQNNPLFPFPIEHYYEMVDLRYQKIRALFTWQTPIMFIPLLLAALVLLLRKQRAVVLLTTLILLTAVDMLAVAWAYNPTLETEHIYPQPEAITVLQAEDEGLFRVVGLGLALVPNSNVVFGLDDIRGYDPMTPRRYANLIKQIEGYTKIGSHVVLWKNDQSPLLDLLNVKYLFNDRQLETDWELIYQNGGGNYLYRNPDVSERAYFVAEAIVAKTPEDSLAKTLDSTFDFRKQVVLEDANLNTGDMTGTDDMSSDIEIISYAPERVVIEIDAATDGFVVLTDSYTADWKVTVDEAPTDLLVANHAFRAVAVTKGTHLIEFVYEPVSFYVGRAVTVATAVLWIVVFLFLILITGKRRDV